MAIKPFEKEKSSVVSKENGTKTITYFSRNAKKQPFAVTIKIDGKMVYINCDCPLGLDKKLCRHKINAMRGDTDKMSPLTTQDTISVLKDIFPNRSSARKFMEDEWRNLRVFSTTSPEKKDEIENWRKKIGTALADGFENTIEKRVFFDMIEWENNRVTIASDLEAPVTFKYTDSDGETTERNVTLHEFFYNNSRYYMYGYCHLRNEMRTFALDRIETVYFSSISLNNEKISLIEDVKKQITNIVVEQGKEDHPATSLEIKSANGG